MPHSIVKPLSSEDISVHDSAFVQADYPALKHFFSPGNMTIGDSIITDQISGLTIALNSNVAAYTAGTEDNGFNFAIADATATSAAWEQQGTGVGLYWCIHDVIAGARGFGFGGAAGTDRVALVEPPNVADAGSAVSLGAVGGASSGNPKAIGALIDIPNDLGTSFGYLHSTEVLTTPAGVALAIGSVTGINPLATARFNGNGFWGCGMMIFADVNEVPSPAQITEGLMWMTHKAVDEGVYAPYPGWKNIS